MGRAQSWAPHSQEMWAENMGSVKAQPPRSAHRCSDIQAWLSSPPLEAHLASQPWCGHHPGWCHGSENLVTVADFYHGGDDQTEAGRLVELPGSAAIPFASQPRVSCTGLLKSSRIKR